MKSTTRGPGRTASDRRATESMLRDAGILLAVVVLGLSFRVGRAVEPAAPPADSPIATRAATLDPPAPALAPAETGTHRERIVTIDGDGVRRVLVIRPAAPPPRPCGAIADPGRLSC